MNALELIAKVQSKPMTHAFVVTFNNGKIWKTETQSYAQAKNGYDRHMKHIGHVYQSRDGDIDATIVNVEIISL